MQPPEKQQKDELESKIRDLDERYLVGVQNAAVASQQAKMNKIQSWAKTDRLINDFFTFSLITLGVMATVLSAGKGIIGNKPLFYVALGLQTFVVILSSVVRLYIDSHTSDSSNEVFKEFNYRIKKIDVYRIAMTDDRPAERSRAQAEMDSSFAPEYDYEPKGNNWMLKNGQKAVVSVFIISFLFFILSLVLNIGINP